MDATVFHTIITAIIGALIGAFSSSYFNNKINDNNNKKIRAIALKALEIFKKYGKKDKKYNDAKTEFNVSMNIIEKRMVLVLLHKLGIPIAFGNEKSFDIENVEFLEVDIKINEINDIEAQIKSGNCDKLFFIDPEEYFSKISLRSYKRNLAIKFINNIFSKGKVNIKDNTIIYPDNLSKYFSPGEINIIQVFKTKIQDCAYFNMNEDMSLPIDEKIAKTIEEIKIGLWDIYLDWSYESYSSVISQGNLANQIADKINQPAPQIDCNK